MGGGVVFFLIWKAQDKLLEGVLWERTTFSLRMVIVVGNRYSQFCDLLVCAVVSFAIPRVQPLGYTSSLAA
jgi:hypothetical protein